MTLSNWPINLWMFEQSGNEPHIYSDTSEANARPRVNKKKILFLLTFDLTSRARQDSNLYFSAVSAPN